MYTKAIVQARMSSSRLPGKVLKNLSNKPLLWHVVQRIKNASKIDEVIIATTEAHADDAIVTWCEENEIACFRGPEEDVLARYYFCAKKFEAQIIVRVTADDPFKDPEIVDEAIEEIFKGAYDFVCNNNPATYPEGLDVEVMTYLALEKSYNESVNQFEREHVTQYIHKNPSKFKIKNLENSEDLSYLRWTIDSQEDFDFVTKVYDILYNEQKLFGSAQIYKLLDRDSSLSKINQNVKRSAMYNEKKK